MVKDFPEVLFMEEESAGGGWHEPDEAASIGPGDYDDEPEADDDVDVRLTLPSSEEAALQELARELGLSVTDAVRESVSLMCFLVEKRNGGQELLLRDESQKLYAVDF